MRVILKETIDTLGIAGSECDVAPGYGRNYLLPQGKAIIATPQNRKVMAQAKAKLELQIAKERKIAEEMADKVKDVVCTIKAKVHEDVRLYGSVTTHDIKESLDSQDIMIERRSILLAEPIKELGEYKVPIRLYKDVEPEITVIVVAEEKRINHSGIPEYYNVFRNATKMMLWLQKNIHTDPLLNRTPPQDAEAEESLLSAIFINNDTLHDIIDILSPDDFYKGAHKKIFTAITELAIKDEPADLVTVANRLNEKNELESVGGAAYLASISDAAPVAVNSIHYARIIKEKSSLRQLISASSNIIERCMKDQGDYTDIMDFAEASIFNIAEKKSKSSFQSLGELINLNIDKLEEQQGKAAGLSGLSTGYSRLNTITSGLQKSDLIILAARPSMGKTAFALNIARNIAFEERKPVAVFSLEMSNEQLSMRLLTSEARIDSNRLRTGFISQEDWQNATDAAGVLNEMPIFIDDTPNITAMEIRAKARKLYKKHNDIGLIIIDYLQLMKPPFKSDRRDLEIAEISRSLKALAKELNVPIVALSQLNRMLEQRADKRPMLSDLRESGALEQDADIVAFIYRDEVYNKEADNPKKGTAEIIIAKNRNGATGVALMHFHGQYTRFEELAPDSYQEYE